MSWKSAGAIKTGFSFAGGNSSLCVCSADSLFRSEFLAAAMALQIGQGYLPSNVRAMDSESECVHRLSAIMVVHATDCSTAQCTPVVAMSATITKHLPKRTSTLTASVFSGRESSFARAGGVSAQKSQWRVGPSDFKWIRRQTACIIAPTAGWLGCQSTDRLRGSRFGSALRGHFVRRFYLRQFTRCDPAHPADHHDTAVVIHIQAGARVQVIEHFPPDDVAAGVDH